MMSIEDRIARFVPTWVRELTPYHIEHADGMVKLDAMENPYPMPPALREQWSDVVLRTELNRYPDPDARALSAALRKHLNIAPELGLVLGNGSDELIHLLCLAVARGREAIIMSPEPSFAVYKIAAQSLGLEFVGVPLSPTDFALDMRAMLAAIERHQPALLFVASPNNPTANLIADGHLETLCQATPGVVVLDEAYARFAGRSWLGEAARCDNLLVMQTFSKFGFAALRVGFVCGSKPWLDLLQRLRMPYNLSALSQAGALFALEHMAHFERQVATIVAAREDLRVALARLPGVVVYPSATNFLLARMPHGRAQRVFESLRGAGVLVKNVTGVHAMLCDCLRITVGTPDENKTFLAALSHALKS
jgi:histidinol-phosphate aminotransferase